MTNIKLPNNSLKFCILMQIFQETLKNEQQNQQYLALPLFLNILVNKGTALMLI